MGLNDSVRRYEPGARSRFEVDSAGEFMDWGVAGGADVTLIVAQATDALKETSMGTVVGSLDRDLLWEVAGFSVVAAVVESKPREVATVAEWVEHLRETGVEIEVTESSGVPGAPNR